jgi:hypothetical protein
LGDYDGREKHVGARFHIPGVWEKTVRMDALVAANLDDPQNRMSFKVTFSFPLTPQSKREEVPSSLFDSNITTLSVDSNYYSKYLFSTVTPKPLDRREVIQRFISSLKQDALSNLTVKYDENSKIIYVEYENTVYRHNEIDAMGAIVQRAISLYPNVDTIVLIPKKSNVPLFALSVDLKSAINYYKKPSPGNMAIFRSSLHITHNMKPSGTTLLNNGNSNRFKTHLTLLPVLQQFVGTDYGVYDYQLLMGVQGSWNIFKGLDASLRYDTKVARSDDLNPNGGRYGQYYNKGGLHSAMLHYTTEMYGFYNRIHAGVFDYEYVGGLDELTYIYGNHTFGVRVGYFQHFGDWEHWDWQGEKKIYVGRYTYSYAPLDLQLEVHAGQYWMRDQGYGITLRKFFGDVAVELRYLDTKPDDAWSTYSEPRNKYVGLYIQLPLDFKKSRTNWKHIQLQGERSWKTGVSTTFRRKDGTNTIVVGSGIIPKMPLSQRSDMLNNDRWSLPYFEKHSDRLLPTNF